MASAGGCVAALLQPTAVYGDETRVLADAATAQDLVGLAVVAPLLLILSLAAARGSLTCWLGCLGCLGFTVYNYAIYAFSIHFGPLFLVWVAVLGLSLFALITGSGADRPPAHQEPLRRCPFSAHGMVPGLDGGAVHPRVARRDRS